MQICLDDRQGSLLPHRAKSVSLFFDAIDSRFGCRNKNIHPRWGPAGTPHGNTELLQTLQNCVQLQHPPKGCFSSWGLPEFTNALRIPPAQSQLCPKRVSPPLWKQTKRVLRGPGSRSSAVPRNSLIRQWCRGDGCKPGVWLRNSFFAIAILPAHTAFIKWKLPCVR